MRFALIGGLEHEFSFSIYWGISYSRLTFIFFRGVGLNHQPGYVCVMCIYIYCIWFKSTISILTLNHQPEDDFPIPIGCRPPCLGRDPLRFSFADGALWRTPPGETAKLRGWREFWVLLWQQWGLVGGLEHFFIFHVTYGMSSFPLTNSYFSRWLKPPTRGKWQFFPMNWVTKGKCAKLAVGGLVEVESHWWWRFQRASL